MLTTYQVQTFQNVSPENFQCATGVMDAISKENLPAYISQFHQKTSGKIILTVFSPSAHHIQIIIDQVFEHYRNIRRIILPVTVNGRDIITRREFEATVQGSRLPIMVIKFHVLYRMQSLANSPGIIRGAVIYYDNLVLRELFITHHLTILEQSAYTLSLIPNWDYH
jgi:hypothetical protein